MARALVVFESMFGHTAEVARAVAARDLDDHVPTEVVEVGAAPARLADGEAARAEAWDDELGIALTAALRGAR
ncbi:hypothetical protein [Actinomycetospora sp. CA-053990]|uniref:hypothetical protein n=1 Tax=Actinomycetospora sp. CA-053990 TaxID=3239891 RepID=UPI003D90E194